jgi:hypothetical protein
VDTLASLRTAALDWICLVTARADRATRSCRIERSDTVERGVSVHQGNGEFHFLASAHFVRDFFKCVTNVRHNALFLRVYFGSNRVDVDSIEIFESLAE